MKAISLIVVLNIFVYCASTVLAECDGSDEISVQIDSGWVCGRRRVAENNHTYASFRGMPYGEQPTGKYRFTPLRKKEPWDGYWNASVEGPMCPQVDVLYGNLVVTNKTMSEECIFVNWHVPLPNSTVELSCQSGLPILIFIHGGAFETGSGDSDLFGPEFLVTKGVIVITFNYRLNILGYLSLNTSLIPGNAGMRDAVTLLEWVQTNAKAFGGDPTNVTLMGQSSGAATAHLLSLSNATVGLFHRLVMMSGTGYSSFFSYSPNFAQNCQSLLLTTLGINSTNTDEICNTLTEIPIEKLMAAQDVVQNQTGITSFCPVIELFSYDNTTMILDGDPIELMKQGRGNNIPILMGCNDKEIFAFDTRLKGLDTIGSIKKYPQSVLSPWNIYDISSNDSSKLAAEVAKKYFSNITEPTYEEYYPLGSDTNFKYTHFYSARQRAQSGGANVYFYYYTYTSETQLCKDALGLGSYEGAVHIEDLTFIFRPNHMIGDHISFPPTTKDDYMRDWMTDFVVNFTRCSDPTCSGGTLWKPFTNESPTYQLIAEPYVYNNTGLTQEQQDMIAFYDSLEEQRTAALSD